MKIKEVTQPLNEVNMSPSALKKSAAAANAKVGIEFEMYIKSTRYVPNEDADFGGESSEDLTMSDIAESFSDQTGYRCISNDKYHGDRPANTWVIEPDGSLTSWPSSKHMAIELISPPITLSEMHKALAQVKGWAYDSDAKTNESTGLHMNVSIPGLNESTLDFAKLIIFLGDHHILEQYDRITNSYCESVLSKLHSRINHASPEQIIKVLDGMKQNMKLTSQKLFQKYVSEKYSSVHLHLDNGYIEFRSPGGDWLNKSTAQLETTLNRFVTALSIACDPQAYKDEYAKKVYKMLADKLPKGLNTMDSFIKYSAGTLTASGLKKILQMVHDPMITGKVNESFDTIEKDTKKTVNYDPASLAASYTSKHGRGDKSGYFSSVQNTPNDPGTITKTTLTPPDDEDHQHEGYYYWARICAQYAKSNPYLPRIYVIDQRTDASGRSMPRYQMEKLHDWQSNKVTPEILIAILRKLDQQAADEYDEELQSRTFSAANPRPYTQFKTMIWGYILEKMNDAIGEYGSNTEDDLANAAGQLIQEVLEQIADETDDMSTLDVDLHGDNMMIRFTNIGPQLVITDPIAGGA